MFQAITKGYATSCGRIYAVFLKQKEKNIANSEKVGKPGNVSFSTLFRSALAMSFNIEATRYVYRRAPRLGTILDW